MRRGFRFLFVGLLIAVGLSLLLAGVYSPRPSCCSKTANGMTECTACAETLFPNPLLVEFGGLLFVLGLFGLVLVAAVHAQRVPSPPI